MGSAKSVTLTGVTVADQACINAAEETTSIFHTMFQDIPKGTDNKGWIEQCQHGSCYDPFSNF